MSKTNRRAPSTVPRNECLRRSGRRFEAAEERRASSTRSQMAANFATVFAAFVAASTFYYGYHQFSETQRATLEALALQKAALEQERDSQAMALFVKYNEMMELPPPGRKATSADIKFWRENNALSIAETIFRLRSEDKNWRETVAWILDNHAETLKEDGLNCESYDPMFVEFVNRHMGRDVCLPR